MFDATDYFKIIPGNLMKFLVILISDESRNPVFQPNSDFNRFNWFKAVLCPNFKRKYRYKGFSA